MAARRPPPTASDFVPLERMLPRLREAAQDCRGCSLYLHATQTVFGEGSTSARVIFVGEQPGDVEDRAGRPFVGPAGRVFDEALKKAGLSRKDAYVTNAVKHFKFEERGKARLHKRPTMAEVKACHPWLQAELGAIRPTVVVLLGATAGFPDYRAARPAATELPRPARDRHGAPSSILRAPDTDARHAAFEALVADLRVVARELAAK